MIVSFFILNIFFRHKTTCVSVFFLIDINIFNKKFESFVKSETKIERLSNIKKHSFNDLSMSVNEIKNIFIYYENDVKKIRTCFSHEVYQKINSKLINVTLFNDNNIIKIDNFQNIIIHENYNWFALSHVIIFRKFFQINSLIELKCDLIDFV